MEVAVLILQHFIQTIDQVYIGTFNMNQSIIVVSLLDVLEIIFGVGVVSSITSIILGLNKEVEMR